jgi:hypothetical protein
MWLHELCRRWFGRSRRRSRVQQRRTIRNDQVRFRLRLETLEDRTLLSGGITTTTGLISAIKSANTAGGSTTITLASNTTFDFTSPYNSSQNALPVITGNITIQGSGDIIERTGTTPFRFFDVASGGSLTLQNVTLTGGLVQGTGTAADGGAVFSSGTLNLSGVTVKSNMAQGSNGPNGTVSHRSGGKGVSANGGGLYVAGGTVTLNNDILSNNAAVGGKGGNGVHTGSGVHTGGTGGNGGAGSGGGMYVAGGTVTLNGDTLSSNKADGGNGGHGFPSGGSGGNGGAGAGGGLYVADGAVTLNGDNLRGNTAAGGKGGNGGFIDGGGGSGAAGAGGSLYVAAGSVTLTNDTLSGNDTHGGSGGNGTSFLGFAFPGGSGGAGSGGGLYVAGGTVTLNGDTLSSNKADGGNGGKGVAPGGGSGGAGSGGGLYVAGGTVTLNGDTLSGNKADGGNGGVASNRLGGSGGAGSGGGLYVAAGSVALINDTLSGNDANGGNGGNIVLPEGGVGIGGAGSGGGLTVAGGTVTLNGDTLSNNKADGGNGGGSAGGKGGGGGGAGSGSGIFSMFASLTVINSTLSGNTAQGGNGAGSATGGSGYGGALFNLDGTATLTYVTVANNSVLAGTGGSNGNASGGGVYNLASGNTITTGGANTATLNLLNSVIGQDSGGHDLVNDSENGNNTNTAQIIGSSSVVQGGAQQLGNGTNSVAAGAISVISAPNLATTLANNGGSTQTLAPLSGSPVFEAGNSALFDLPTVDQRGLLRPNATSTIRPDDGAFQTQTTTTTVTNVTTAYTSAGLTVALTANVDANGLPVTEGSVQFSVDGVSQTATISSSNPGVAKATITLASTVSLGDYTFEAAYTDPNAVYSPSNGTGAITLRTASSSLSVTDTNSPIAYNSSSETLALQANVTSTNGGAVNEGAIVFTVNGVSSAPVPVSNGAASTTLLLSGTSLLNAGSYANGISAAYTDAATNDFAAANATGALTVAAEATSITTSSISSTYNSTTVQTVTLSGSVASSNNGTVNEGSITFTVKGTNLAATGLVHNSTATATLTLPAGLAAGAYSLTASYADSPNANRLVNFNAITSANAATLTINAATVTTTLLNIATPITIPHGQAVTLAADVSSSNGGTVNEGTVTFTVINPNGANLTATGSAHSGTATATLTLPNNFAPGTNVYIAGYADSNNLNGVANYAARNGVGTVDPPGSATGTLTVVNAPISNPPAGNPPADSGSGSPPAAPLGGLSPFAIGWGPTGIDLFEVDSQGDIFAQSLFGGGLQLVNTSLQLPLVLMTDEGLMALVVGENGQDYVIEVSDPLLPSIEAAVLAALRL